MESLKSSLDLSGTEGDKQNRLCPWKVSSPGESASPAPGPLCPDSAAGSSLCRPCWGALACAWQVRPCGPLGHPSKAAEPLPAQSKGREQWRGTQVETLIPQTAPASPSHLPVENLCPGRTSQFWCANKTGISGSAGFFGFAEPCQEGGSVGRAAPAPPARRPPFCSQAEPRNACGHGCLPAFLAHA